MKFLWPIDKEFRWISGYHYDPPNHNGIDYATKTGSNYYAPQDGKIVTARFDLAPNTTGQQYGYGNNIKIDHGNEWTTLGAHLLEGYVSVGDIVKAGQLIAKTDNTGWSTGAHLHFEIKVNGSPVNPEDYLVDTLEPELPSFSDPTIPTLPIAVVDISSDSWLNIRSYPKTTSISKVVGRLYKGDELSVMKIIMDGLDKWLQIGYNQYICMLYNGNQLCVWK